MLSLGFGQVTWVLSKGVRHAGQGLGAELKLGERAGAVSAEQGDLRTSLGVKSAWATPEKGGGLSSEDQLQVGFRRKRRVMRIMQQDNPDTISREPVGEMGSLRTWAQKLQTHPRA